MIVFKVNVISELKKAGYSTYRIREEHIMSERTLQHYREGKVPTAKVLNQLCQLLDCQPGTLIKYVPNKQD